MLLGSQQTADRGGTESGGAHKSRGARATSKELPRELGIGTEHRGPREGVALRRRVYLSEQVQRCDNRSRAKSRPRQSELLKIDSPKPTAEPERKLFAPLANYTGIFSFLLFATIFTCGRRPGTRSPRGADRNQPPCVGYSFAVVKAAMALLCPVLSLRVET